MGDILWASCARHSFRNTKPFAELSVKDLQHIQRGRCKVIQQQQREQRDHEERAVADLDSAQADRDEADKLDVWGLFGGMAHMQLEEQEVEVSRGKVEQV